MLFTFLILSSSRFKYMKFSSLLIVAAFIGAFFQHGCDNINSDNRSPANNQNSLVVSASPTSSPSSSPTQNTNVSNNGATAEEARPFIELQERCKHAPVNKASITPRTGTAPLTVEFDGTPAYDPDGTKIVKWKWHFGNGQSTEGRRVKYTYEKPGNYGIGLDATDSQGQKTSDCGTGATDIEIIVTK